MIGEHVPFYVKIWLKLTQWPTRFKDSDFQSLFACSATVVTSSERSSINTNRKSTTSFPMSLRWTVYVAPKPFPRGLNNAKWSFFIQKKFEQQSAITSKRYEIGCQLVLITNSKSHTGFRFIPTSVTLNDLERRISPYFALFHRNR